MVGYSVEDGDLLVVEEDEAPLGGEEEVTVKRIYREDGKLRLKPENVRVPGRVVHVSHPSRKKAIGGGA